MLVHGVAVRDFLDCDAADVVYGLDLLGLIALRDGADDVGGADGSAVCVRGYGNVVYDESQRRDLQRLGTLSDEEAVAGT